MILQDLKDFLDACTHQNIEVPRGLAAVVDDFYSVVPDTFHALGRCEFNFRTVHGHIPIDIIAPDKAVKYNPFNNCDL